MLKRGWRSILLLLLALMLACSAFAGCGADVDDGDTPVPPPPPPPPVDEGAVARDAKIAEETARVKPFTFTGVEELAGNTYRVDDVFEVSFDISETFEEADVYSPYVVDIAAYITTPSDETVKAIGFYKQDTGKKWAFRYSPSEVGEHSYYLKDEKGGAVSETATFTAIDKEAHRGRLSVSGNKFIDGNGDVLPVIGTNFLDYPLEDNQKFEENIQTKTDGYYYEKHKDHHSYEGKIPEFAEAGATMMRIWSEYHPGVLALELAPGPVTERGNVSINYKGIGNYQLDNAARLDRLFDLFIEHDMYLNLTIFNQWIFRAENVHKNPYYEGNPGGMCLINGGLTNFWSHELAIKYQMQLFRYYNARFSAYRSFAIIEWRNEIDSEASPIKTTDGLTWMYRMTEYWQTMNIHKVLTSFSYSSSDHAPADKNPWRNFGFVDVAQPHQYMEKGNNPVNDDPDNRISWLATLNGVSGAFDGPVILAEFGDSGTIKGDFADSDARWEAVGWVDENFYLEGLWAPQFFANTAGGGMLWKINSTFVLTPNNFNAMKVFSDTLYRFKDRLLDMTHTYTPADSNGLQIGGYTGEDAAVLYVRDSKANSTNETVLLTNNKTVTCQPHMTSEPRIVSDYEKALSGLTAGTYTVQYLNLREGGTLPYAYAPTASNPNPGAGPYVAQETVTVGADGTLTLSFPDFARYMAVIVEKM